MYTSLVCSFENVRARGDLGGLPRLVIVLVVVVVFKR